jgi:hypothetical protein
MRIAVAINMPQFSRYRLFYHLVVHHLPQSYCSLSYHSDTWLKMKESNFEIKPINSE